MNPTFHYLTRKQFAAIKPAFPCNAFTSLRDRACYFKPHPTTRTRLHEYYHAKYSKESVCDSWDDWLVDELEARAFANKLMNKNEFGATEILSLVAFLICRMRMRVNEATGIVEYALQECGIDLRDDGFSDIWQYARHLYTHRNDKIMPIWRPGGG